MNLEIKQQWVAALQSGTYAQGKNWLRKHDSYCCHGVLCDLYIQGHGHTQWIENQYGCWRVVHTTPALPDIRFQYCLPPFSVYTWWAGVSEEEVQTLARMNDEGETFAGIATWITEHL